MAIAILKAWGLSHWKNEKVRQTLLLFAVSLCTLPIGVLTNIVLSRYLDADGFGNYQFLDNVFNFSVLFFTFGFFFAANRALVLNKDKQKAREYFGASLIIFFGLFVAMAAVLILYALFDKNLHTKHLSGVLLFSIPFAWAYLATNFFETLFQADNRIKLLAAARLLPKIGFLALGAVFYVLLKSKEINRLYVAWGFYIGMQALSAAVIFRAVKPSFKKLRSSVRDIWKFNINYGFHVYTGSVFSVGLAGISGILISYFGSNNSGVGFYALAISLTSPLQLIPNSIATTNYKEFSEKKKIPKNITQLTLILTVISLCALWCITPLFIDHLFSYKFQPVIYVTFIISIGIASYGMGDFYNRFLGAHGQGKSLRNTSFIVGIVVLVSNLILIPVFGVIGAAFSRLFAGICYLTCMLYHYRRRVSRPVSVDISVQFAGSNQENHAN